MRDCGSVTGKLDGAFVLTNTLIVKGNMSNGDMNGYCPGRRATPCQEIARFEEETTNSFDEKSMNLDEERNFN
jgi:hypothetical protein